MNVSRGMLWTLVGTGVVSLLAMPFLLRADNAVREQRAQQIEAMTSVERNRLERNARRFAELSPAQQLQMRQLHRQLEDDGTRNHGRHQATLELYTQWLQSISPLDRDELQREADPVRRLVLVREMVDRQRDARLESQLEGGRFSQLQQRLGPLPLLNEQDFLAVLEQIQRRVQLGLTPQMRQELATFTGVRRALKLMELLSQSGNGLSDLVDAATLKRIEDAISDETAREQLRTIPDAALPRGAAERAGDNAPQRETVLRAQLRKWKVLVTVAKNVEHWLEQERPRLVPDDASLQSFFAELPEPAQDELLELPPEQFHAQLRRRFIEEELRGYNIDVRKVRQFLMPSDALRSRLPTPRDTDPRRP